MRVVTKLRDASIAMKLTIPSRIILTDLDPVMESRVSNDTAIVISRGVARPIRDEIPSTYIISTERICSCCTKHLEISISAILVARFFVFPFIEAMSGPHISSAILKSVPVTVKLTPLVTMSIA